MKKIFFSFLIGCSFLFSYEDDCECIPICEPVCEWIYVCDEDLSSLYLGPQVAYLDLSIKSFPGLGFVGSDGDLDLGGVLGGIIGEYEYKKFHSLYVGIYSSWLAGKVTASNNPSRFVHDVEAEGKFGYTYTALQGKEITVTPFIGFGFNWNYQKRDPFNNVQQIVFEYYKYYIPVGFLLNYEWMDFFHVGFQFKWMPEVDPTLKIDMLRAAFTKSFLFIGFFSL